MQKAKASNKKAKTTTCGGGGREATVAGPALIPPSVEDWDPMLLAYTSRRVTINELFAGPEDATVAAIGGVLSQEECRAWINHGERNGFELAKHSATAYIAKRDCGRQVVEDDDIAHSIFQRIRAFVPATLKPPGSKRTFVATTCASNLRLYKVNE